MYDVIETACIGVKAYPGDIILLSIFVRIIVADDI